MNKKILFLLAMFGIMVGCESHMAAQGMQACAPYTGSPAACSGDKNDPKVTIDLDTMTVTPECIKAKKDKVIHFKIDSGSAITKNSVEIFAKDSANDFWLAGTNSSKTNILIKVPKNKKNGGSFPTGKYSFGIRMPNGCIDPRVSVED